MSSISVSGGTRPPELIPIRRLAMACPGPETIAELAAVDPQELDDVDRLDLLAALERAAGWLSWLSTRALAALPRDVFGDWCVDQVALALHTGAGEAHKRLSTARDLAQLPATERALAEGRISMAHAEGISLAVTRLPAADRLAVDAALPVRPGQHPAGPPETGRRGEYDLFGRTALTPARLRAQAMRAAAEQRPDLLEESGRRAHASRGLWYWPPYTPESGGFDARLPLPEFEQLRALIEAHATRRGPDDHRSPSARRLDALLDLVLHPRASSGQPSEPGEEPTTAGGAAPGPWGRPGGEQVGTLPHTVALHVLTPALTLTGGGQPGVLLPGGQPLSPSTVRRLACGAAAADLLLYDPATDDLLTLGPAHRFPTRRLRSYLTLRDHSCRWPGCEHPPERCDAHHVIYRSHDGPTTPSNMVLLCPAHHRALHEGGWRLSGDAQHALTLTSPTGHVYHSEPPPARSRLLGRVGTEVAKVADELDYPGELLEPDWDLPPDPRPEPAWAVEGRGSSESVPGSAA